VNVQKKVLLGFLALLIFVMITGGLSIFQMNQMGNKTKVIQNDWLPGVLLLGEINGHAVNTPRLLGTMGLETDPEVIAMIEQEVQRTLEKIDLRLADYEKLLSKEDEKDRQNYEKYVAAWKAYKNEVPGLVITAKGTDTHKTIRELKRTNATWKTSQDVLQEMIEYNKQGSQAVADETVKINSNSQLILITVMIIAILASMALIFFILRDIRAVASDIRQSSETVASSSEEITASVQEIATGSLHQTNMVNSITEMIEQMDVAISQIASHIEEASSLVNQSSTVAESGGKLMNNAMEGMQEISNKVNYLLENSRKIDLIVTTIKEIADETKLLALNASIEAARAGEHGRGFAVVADSVGKLANQSGEATKQIIQLVQSMQESTQDTVETVRSGNELILQAGDSFKNIIENVNHSAARIVEVAASCEEQAAQTNDILQSAQNIAAVTEQTSASTEETASATEELASMAEKMNIYVQKL
jgi:methyl-accepting chemotaxis protein